MNVAALESLSSHPAEAAGQGLSVTRSNGKPLTGKALRNASPAEQSKEVAAQFEAILVRQLLAPTMTSMLGKEGGTASNVYGDMLTDSFAQQLTRGGGLGLGGLLAQQLAPRAPRVGLNSSLDSAENP